MKWIIALFCALSSSLWASADVSQFIRQRADGRYLALQDYLAACFKAGKKKITLPAGKFMVEKGAVITGKKGFVISGAGAGRTTLVFRHLKPVLEGKSRKVEGGCAGFYLERCADFQLRDLAVDFDPLPFVQGTITEVRQGGREFILKLHKGYPRAHRFFTEGNVSGVLIFDSKTRRFKPDVYENYYKCIIQDKETYLCTRAAYPQWNIHKIKVGDLAAFGYRSISAFRMEQCSRYLLENLTVYTAPGMGYYSMYAKDHRYRNIRIVRGERPRGASEDRLLAAVADGFTHRYAFTGPILENSEFSFMGDDSINISSHVHPVLKIDGRKIIVAARYPDMRLELIDPHFNSESVGRFVDFKTWGLIGSPKIAGIKKIKGSAALLPQELAAQWRLRKGPQSFFELTFKEPLPAALRVGDGVYFPDCNGRGFVIRNNYFHDHRAVGLRLMAEDGLVENNRFERLAFGAIELACSMGVWRESGWSRNVVIRGNRIRSVNEHPNRTEHIGAIASRVEYRGFTPPKYPVCHENILIQNNHIEDVCVDGISLTGAGNVKIEGNTIKNYNTISSGKNGYLNNLLRGYGICVQQSGKILLKDNKISTPGKFSRGKCIINPPDGKTLAVMETNKIWNIKGNQPQKDVIYPEFDYKGGVKLHRNGKIIFDDTNGVGLLQTVPREKGLAGWGDLDWQRRTPAPERENADGGKTVSFLLDDKDIRIRKVCRMISPQEFSISLSADCSKGDTFSYTARLPLAFYTGSQILESDGKGYPLARINPLSSGIFKGRKSSWDNLRTDLGRFTLRQGETSFSFTLKSSAAVASPARDYGWLLAGGVRNGKAADFQLRRRMYFVDGSGKSKPVSFELKIKTAALKAEKR